MCSYLYGCLLTYLPVYLPLCVPACRSVFMSACPSASLAICLHVGFRRLLHQAVELTASQNLAQKRSGYLTASLTLSPTHEFRFMLVNQMQRDLNSSNMLEAAAALTALCKLGESVSQRRRHIVRVSYGRLLCSRYRFVARLAYPLTTSVIYVAVSLLRLYYYGSSTAFVIMMTFIMFDLSFFPPHHVQTNVRRRLLTNRRMKKLTQTNQ